MARRVRNRRPTLRFEILKHSPRPADRRANYDTSQRLLSIDSLSNELAEQKRRRRYSKGGVGERLWSWGEEASDPRRESKCAHREIQAAP